MPRFKESSLDASTFSAAKTHFFQNDSRPSPTYRNSFSLRGVEKTLLNAFLADSGRDVGKAVRFGVIGVDVVDRSGRRDENTTGIH